MLSYCNYYLSQQTLVTNLQDILFSVQMQRPLGLAYMIVLYTGMSGHLKQKQKCCSLSWQRIVG